MPSVTFDHVRKEFGETTVVEDFNLEVADGELLVLVGWAILVTLLFKDLENLAGSFDSWLWLLQIAGLIVFVGAVVVSGWNAWLTFKDGRRWTRKLWSVLVVLATLVILYVAARFGLLAMSVSY